MIDVSGLRHPDDRLNEQPGARFFDRTMRELHVRPVHRIACLKGDNPLPAASGELATQLRRRSTE
jgi:hypothetical protein